MALFCNRFLFCLIFACVVCIPFGAGAQQSPQIIRDTETEAYLKTWSEPIFHAANLDPNSVKMILVQNNDVNAFVAGGSNIFIYTGLIEKTESLDELLGVIAHETGHISGGHLTRSREAMRQSSYESLLGAVLGISTAIISGQAGAGAAVAQGSQGMALNRYLYNSRIQESSADQAALSFFQKAKFSPSGMVKFMQKLQSQEYLPASQQSSYMRTHPLTSDRVLAFENGADQSPYRDAMLPKDWQAQYSRMKAKLTGYMYPQKIAWAYPDSDTSIDANYARAMAAWRSGQLDHAEKLLRGLVATEPNNPFFQENLGQFLYENGKVKESIPFYEDSARLLPQSSLIQLAYGQSLSAVAEDQNQLEKAALVIKKALNLDPALFRAYRQMAIIEGKLGNLAVADYYLAEEAFSLGDIKKSKALADKSKQVLQKTQDSNLLKLQDLLERINAVEDEKEG
jgi:predicted Zn-dependent protease